MNVKENLEVLAVFIIVGLICTTCVFVGSTLSHYWASGGNLADIKTEAIVRELGWCDAEGDFHWNEPAKCQRPHAMEKMEVKTATPITPRLIGE